VIDGAGAMQTLIEPLTTKRRKVRATYKRLVVTDDSDTDNAIDFGGSEDPGEIDAYFRIEYPKATAPGFDMKTFNYSDQISDKAGNAAGNPKNVRNLPSTFFHETVLMSGHDATLRLSADGVDDDDWGPSDHAYSSQIYLATKIGSEEETMTDEPFSLPAHGEDLKFEAQGVYSVSYA
jgi:hypothetical protein